MEREIEKMWGKFKKVIVSITVCACEGMKNDVLDGGMMKWQEQLKKKEAKNRHRIVNWSE